MKTLTKLAICSLLLAGSAPGANLHLGQTLDQWKIQLRSPDRLERLLAARSLGEMAIAGMPDADKAVFEAIEHEDSAVRYWAVVAAGQMGERARPARDLLLRALNDPVPEVRCWAGYAVARLGEADKALAVLIREMSNEEKGARLQAVHVIDALGETARPTSDVLHKALGDEFDYVQRVARHALWVLGERLCPYRECRAESSK